VRGVLLECAGCGCQTSVTAGTIFQDTRTPLPVWFHAMWWLTTQKNGASALGLQRVLGLRKYETAWTWLHKLRRAMVRPGRDLLTGRVEVDEAYWGGQEEGLTGRQTVSHKHLDYYLDEFTFRFNRRRSKSRGKLFFRLAQQAVAIDPVPYDLIVHPTRTRAKTRPQHNGAT
jgi:hypothetical protein